MRSLYQRLRYTAISDQLIVRLGDEDDPVVLGQFAEVLVAVATQLSWAGRLPVSR